MKKDEHENQHKIKQEPQQIPRNLTQDEKMTLVQQEAIARGNEERHDILAKPEKSMLERTFLPQPEERSTIQVSPRFPEESNILTMDQKLALVRQEAIARSNDERQRILSPLPKSMLKMPLPPSSHVPSHTK